MTVAQLVHEHETQRQHVRIRIPARAQVAGRDYAVRDLSAGGAALEGVDLAFLPGNEIALTLVVPFSGYAFHAGFSARVEYYNAAAKTLGLRFSALNNEQVSLLAALIRSYMSGVVMTQGEILNVVARDNFLKLRREETAPRRLTAGQALWRALPALLALAAGIGAFAFIGANIYDKLYVLHSEQASVALETLTLRAAADGVFTAQIPEGTDTVARGQTLGTITPATGAPVALASPCTCTLAAQFAQDGMVRMVGEPVFRLIPAEAAPLVKAQLPSDQAQRLGLGGRASFHIAGEAGAFAGKIAAIEAQGVASPLSVVTIRPDIALPYRLSERPARVSFFVQ
jgi:alginate biosynthesis protein Alg44